MLTNSPRTLAAIISEVISVFITPLNYSLSMYGPLSQHYLLCVLNFSIIAFVNPKFCT